MMSKGIIQDDRLDELMNLIQKKCAYIKSIRNLDGRIQVQIPCIYANSEISWIEIFQAPIQVEKVIKSWLAMGEKV